MFLSDPRDSAITFGAPGSTATLAEYLKETSSINDPDFAGVNKTGENFSAGVVAAYRQNRLVNFTSSQDAAMAEAADHRIRTVQEQTGVQLENPFRDGYFKDASRAIDEAGGSANLQDNRYQAIIAQQRRIFDDKIDEVLTNFPDKAKALDFGQSIEDQAKAISAGAEYDGEHHQGGFMASIVGGLAAAARDPVQVGALFATGGESVAGTALARVGWNALRQGLLNAGLSAIEQPAVQEWRRDIGARSGVLPSLENVGMNFMFGAIIGGAVHTGVELVRADRDALARVMDGTAKPGDIEQAARGLGVTIDKDTAATIKTAEADLSNGALARDTLPDGLPESLGADLERQAIRHAQDPANEPPPSLASPAVVAPDVPGAERLMGDFEGRPLDGVAALRGSPEMIEGALRSDLPEVVQSGRLASLSDEGFAMVADGRARPEHGVIAGELSPDPSFDAIVLSRLSDARPESPTEARLIAADAIEREAGRRARATLPAPDALASKMFAAPDPLDLAMSGELTAVKAKEIADAIKASQRDIENSIFGDRADEWRKLNRKSDRAWDNARDAEAKATDAQIAQLEREVGLTQQHEDFLDGVGWSKHSDPDDWLALSRNLDDIAFGRVDAIAAAASAVRYIPKTRVWEKMTSREQESVITILSAMNEEQRLGRDTGQFLKDVFNERFNRYGRSADAAEVTEAQMRELSELMSGAIEREAPQAPPTAPSSQAALPMPDGTARDVMDLVPMLREDGTVILSTPEAVGLMADHQEGLANLVKACQL